MYNYIFNIIKQFFFNNFFINIQKKNNNNNKNITTIQDKFTNEMNVLKLNLK